MRSLQCLRFLQPSVLGHQFLGKVHEASCKFPEVYNFVHTAPQIFAVFLHVLFYQNELIECHVSDGTMIMFYIIAVRSLL